MDGWDERGVLLISLLTLTYIHTSIEPHPPPTATKQAKGVGFVHTGMAETDRRRVWELYAAGAAQVIDE